MNRGLYAAGTARPSPVVSLDGLTEWRVAPDAQNVGREEQWWQRVRPEAKPIRVPGTIQEILPGCHGVAWYWREVKFPVHPQADGRYLLRFWMVNYVADVWLNDVPVGHHEGGEEPFTLDVTTAARPGAVNRLAVRVLSPGDEPIDGITRRNTPQRGRQCKPTLGSEYQCGGLMDSVELLVCPALRIEDLCVWPDWQTGELQIRANVRNAGQAATSRLHVAVAPAASGVTFAGADVERSFAAGDTPVTVTLKVDRHRLWTLTDPFLYRVTARLDGPRGSADEVSARCGFRDFRFADGAFRLNGKRIFLKGSFTGNMVPAGYRVPRDPDLLRRDLLSSKVLGMNIIRFFGAVPRRDQLDLCDEIGLLVLEESGVNWQWEDSPEMPARFDATIRGMIARDRNHPSVVMWGLLNETRDGPIFRHAVDMLPVVHGLDDTRVVLLNSGLEQFVPSKQVPRVGFGALCNPRAKAWQNTLLDSHPYQRSPHLPEHIAKLRDTAPGEPVFISEYGVCSAVDLVRQMRHYEQIGCEASENALIYRGFLDRFLVDWQRWNMAAVFGTPEEYFRQCVAKMAGLRREGLNAIRANPWCVGHLMTGTYDHGYLGEGILGTEFRDLKPGAADALFDGFYPLRLCLFAEPPHALRGAKIRFDAVLANEDALRPGTYPIRLQILGPGGRSVLDRTVSVKIPELGRPLTPAPLPQGERGSKAGTVPQGERGFGAGTVPQGERGANRELPLAIPLFGEEVAVDGPTGKYQFLAAFQRGGAAAGGTAEFYVTDPADMPRPTAKITLWGGDSLAARWLAERGIATCAFSADKQSGREVILVGRQPPVGDAVAWRSLAEHIARGSTAIFLRPEVFRRGKNLVAWVPLRNKGTLVHKRDWLYPHDHWATRHPLFAGLPTGVLWDYTYYRNVLSDSRWADLDVPAELVAATINTSMGYDAGLLMGVYRLGAGRFVLNTLAIGDQLGRDPVADRLLCNLLCYAAAEADRPLAELPADFAAQLKSFGY
jgi:hypothetical protein